MAAAPNLLLLTIAQDRQLPLQDDVIQGWYGGQVVTLTRPQMGSVASRFESFVNRKIELLKRRSAGRFGKGQIAHLTSEILNATEPPGCPRMTGEIEALVVRWAEGNRAWGYRRIQGALSHLGHPITRSTIAAILARYGLEPAPEWSRKTSWKEFLARHWELIVAADFFTVEEWT